MVSQFVLNKKKQKVKYEYLLSICFKCGRVGHCEAFYSLDLDGKLNPVNTSDGGVHGSDDSDNLGEPKGQLVLGWLFNTKGGRFRVRIAIF